ncbi:hypothetical protein B0H14DRAFT_3738226 [Mycena olivaceomarginata]|nr:hypothetical protein B0H14DRAFT_3738226 [Mycena olivaceomarginata]
MTVESENGPTENTKHEGPPIKTLQLGVYRVVTEVFPPLNLREQWNNASRLSSNWLRLIQVYRAHVEPAPVKPSTRHHFNRLEEPGPAIFQAVALRMPNWRRTLLAFKANLGSKHISERRAWLTFSSSIDVTYNMVGAIGQLTYISRTALSTGQGTIFGLLCLVHPVLEAVFERIPYNHPHIVEENDQHFLRMKGPPKGGDLPYPPLGRPHEHGMPFELKNVSFSYSGTAANALDNRQEHDRQAADAAVRRELRVAQRRRRGHQAYRLADLRHATAALTQDRHLYLLSLRENVGLGNPADVRDMDMIRAAARWGGAEEVIAKMGEGFETGLEHPRGLQYGVDVGGQDASGLVCVDEPSSNPQPRGGVAVVPEPQAGARRQDHALRHRPFAHLTKHADVILCLKDGRILETGTHTELMTFEREYCKMFKIQATAFE